MYIRITERTKASLDGTHVITLDEGAETDAPLAVAESLIEQGKAVAIDLPAGPEPLTPDEAAALSTPVPAEPAPAAPTAHDSTAGAPAPGEATTVAHAAAQGEHVAGSTLPVAPPANASRATCDAVATELGMDPAVYATRDEVRDAIIARLDGLAAQQA